MHNDESVTRSLAIINSSSRRTLIHRLTGCDGDDQDGDGGDTPRHQRASRRHIQRSVGLCSCRRLSSTGFSDRTLLERRRRYEPKTRAGRLTGRRCAEEACTHDDEWPPITTVRCRQASGDGRESLIAELAADTKYWQPWCCESSLAGTVLLTATAAAPPSTTASSSSSSQRNVPTLLPSGDQPPLIPAGRGIAVTRADDQRFLGFFFIPQISL